MRRFPQIVAAAVAFVSLHGCVPVPVSRDPLHARAARPVAVELPASAGGATFSVPAFDAGGERLAVFDSASRDIQIRRTADLSLLTSVHPTRWPRRLAFSPSGRFLIAEAYAGWVDAYLRGAGQTATGGAGSADAGGDYRDNVQRAEVWALATGERVAELACDAVVTTEPQRGWLWARNKAIVPGSRDSALLVTTFAADESELEVLCWTGATQRWQTADWMRLPDRPPAGAWSERMRHTPAGTLTDEGSAAGTADGLAVVVRALEPGQRFATTYLWRRRGEVAERWPGDCAVRQLPAQALAADGQRVAAICNAGLGYALHVWDLARGGEVPLDSADFGATKGAALIRSQGVALSADGRYLAAVVLKAAQLLLVTPVPGVAGDVARSDLRLWRVSDGREVASVPVDPLVAAADYFHGVDVAMASAADRLVVAGRGLRIYRLAELDVPTP